MPNLDAGRRKDIQKATVLGWPELIPYLSLSVPFAIWSYGPGYRLTPNNV